MAVSGLWTLAAIALLLAVSALFSGAEISLLSLGRHRARRVTSGRTGALIERLLASPATTLGAILIAITAANYAAEAIAATWIITQAGLPVWIAMVGVSVLVLVLAEAVPISYAAANPERVARAVAVPVWIALGLFSLPARAVAFTASRVTALLGARPRPEPPVTEEEIRAIVDLQAETGGLEEEEKDMIHQVFEFGDKVASEVMVPRADMVAVTDAATVGGIAGVFARHRVSRLPVYRESLDRMVGVVHVEDALPLLASGKAELLITALMRPILQVPGTMKLSDLLAEFRRRRCTLAVVVDEAAHTAGLVTLEDLLEEVVGDIYDEHD